MKIGMIAGNGSFPLMFAKKAAEKGYLVHAVAYEKAADPAIEEHVHAIKWLNLGEVEKLLDFFKGHQVAEAVMVGGVAKSIMFSEFKPDATAMSIIAAMTDTHDDGLLRKFAECLEENGITVRSSTFLLPEILAEPGCWTKRQPNDAEKNDMSLGWRVAEAIGRIDVGQCVVVEKGSVLAVEAIDGTDATIRRGGSLGGGNAVVVKRCKPEQDMRFDIPAVGLETIISMAAAKAPILVVEAGKTVVFDKDKMLAAADEKDMCIVALEDEAVLKQ